MVSPYEVTNPEFLSMHDVSVPLSEYVYSYSSVSPPSNDTPLILPSSLYAYDTDCPFAYETDVNRLFSSYELVTISVSFILMLVLLPHSFITKAIICN